MENSEALENDGPPAIKPYEELGLDKAATTEDIKKAYRKAALKHHPDKVHDSKREEAHQKFQNIAFAYAILSDPRRRKRYDTTGSTSESIGQSDVFSWAQYFEEQFKDAISTEAIEAFAKEYRGSDEEKDDVLSAYEESEGNMDLIYETVMLSNVLQDDARFRKIIDKAIKNGDVTAYPTYTKEKESTRKRRIKEAKSEATEAEEYAKEIGVHDKLFGVTVETQDDEDEEGPAAPKKNKGKGKATTSKKKKENSEDALAALIQQNQRRREGFLDNLIEKYEGKEAKKGKGRGGIANAAPPSEEEFEAIAKKLEKNRQKKRVDDEDEEDLQPQKKKRATRRG